MPSFNGKESQPFGIEKRQYANKLSITERVATNLIRITGKYFPQITANILYNLPRQTFSIEFFGEYLLVQSSDTSLETKFQKSVADKDFLIGRTVGEIHISSEENPNPSFFQQAKYLKTSIKQSLSELALASMNEESEMSGIDYFFGISRLAPLTESLGFTVVPVENELVETAHYIKTKAMVSEDFVKGAGSEWRLENLKRPMLTYISREDLQRNYSKGLYK